MPNLENNAIYCIIKRFILTALFPQRIALILIVKNGLCLFKGRSFILLFVFLLA